jgi:arsenite methyltransferase
LWAVAGVSRLKIAVRLTFRVGTWRPDGDGRSLVTTTPVPPVDVDLLREEIRKTYAAVSREPEREFIFPTGRAWAEDLDYPEELANVPESAVESFAGVANPFSLGEIEPGERVLDLGCGAGTDSLIAARFVGAEGSVTGVDMTPEMLEKARAAAEVMGVGHVTFIEADAERLPFADGSFDVVISNGVIDLIPDKDAVFSGIFRVLVPGGRMQAADVTIQRPVSEEGKKNIDLWTG